MQYEIDNIPCNVGWVQEPPQVRTVLANSECSRMVSPWLSFMPLPRTYRYLGAEPGHFGAFCSIHSRPWTTQEEAAELFLRQKLNIPNFSFYSGRACFGDNTNPDRRFVFFPPHQKFWFSEFNSFQAYYSRSDDSFHPMDLISRVYFAMWDFSQPDRILKVLADFGY